MRGPIAPGTLETIQEPAVGKSFKTLCSDWRPGAIAAETLQTFPIFGMNGNVGVDAKARHGGAAWAEQCVDTFRIDLISRAAHAPSGVGAKGDFAKYGGRVQAGQPRLIARERIRFFWIALGAQAAALQKFRNALG